VTIPRKRNERRRDPFGRAAHRARNRVERRIKSLQAVPPPGDARREARRELPDDWLVAAIVLWL
jgi:hypothetical protein